MKKNWLGRVVGDFDEFIVNLLRALATYPEWSDAKKEESKAGPANLSHGG